MLDLCQIGKIDANDFIRDGAVQDIYMQDIGHRASCMEDIIAAVSENLEESSLQFLPHGSVKTSLPERNSGEGFNLSIQMYSYTINRGWRGAAIAKHAMYTLPPLPGDPLDSTLVRMKRNDQ